MKMTGQSVWFCHHIISHQTVHTPFLTENQIVHCAKLHAKGAKLLQKLQHLSQGSFVKIFFESFLNFFFGFFSAKAYDGSGGSMTGYTLVHRDSGIVDAMRRWMKI